MESGSEVNRLPGPALARFFSDFAYLIPHLERQDWTAELSMKQTSIVLKLYNNRHLSVKHISIAIASIMANQGILGKKFNTPVCTFQPSATARSQSTTISGRDDANISQ